LKHGWGCSGSSVLFTFVVITYFLPVRKFIRVSNEARRSASVRYTTQQEFQPGSKFGEIIDEMGLVSLLALI